MRSLRQCQQVIEARQRPKADLTVTTTALTEIQPAGERRMMTVSITMPFARLREDKRAYQCSRCQTDDLSVMSKRVSSFQLISGPQLSLHSRWNGAALLHVHLLNIAEARACDYRVIPAVG